MSGGIQKFEQLRRELVEQIDSGELAVGDRLAPVRQLAQERGLAPGTVARVYKELEAAGYVVTRGRAGTTVALRDQRSADVTEALASEAAAFAARARALGVDHREAENALRDAWRA